MDPRQLTEIQLDALREVTHIGCGAAATALSQLTGNRKVLLAVTRSMITEAEALPTLLGGADQVVAGIHVDLLGPVRGAMVLTYRDKQARHLASLLTGNPSPPGQPLGSVEASALMEVGNIVSSAYLNAVGRVTGLMLLPSVPDLVYDRAQTVAARVLEEAGHPDRLLVLETWLEANGGNGFDGHVVIVPHHDTLAALLENLGF